MTSIRIVLAEMPELLHEILATQIEAARDMETVGGHATHEDATALVRQGAASVVIVGLEGNALPAAYGCMLGEVPRSRVYAIREHGRNVWLHKMSPLNEPLGDLAPAALLDAIRHGT